MSRLYGVAVLAYPTPYRAAHGPELIDTATNLAGGRFSARQWLSLVSGGLTTRCRLATDGDPTTIVARGVTFGLLLASLVWISTIVTVYRTSSALSDVLGVPMIAFLLGTSLLPLLILSVTTRWPAAVAIPTLRILEWGAQLADATPGGPEPIKASNLVSLITIAALLVFVARWGPGTPAVTPRTLVLLLAVAVAAGLVRQPMVGLVLVVLVALVVSSADPRLLIAATTFYTVTALQTFALYPVTLDLALTGLATLVPVVTVGATITRRSTRRMVER